LLVYVEMDFYINLAISDGSNVITYTLTIAHLTTKVITLS